MLLDVVPPNIDLFWGSVIFTNVESGLWNRDRNAVDICRLCEGSMYVRLAIGFAALNAPFGIAARVCRMPNGVWGTNLGLILEENDEGRSRRHSGSSILEGYMWR